jgi:hypothetical protein
VAKLVQRQAPRSHSTSAITRTRGVGSHDLLIEAPSAAAAVVLAGSLGSFGARAEHQSDRWVVLVRPDSPGGGHQGTIGEVLSVTRRWLLECNVSATSVFYDGQAHVMRLEDTFPLAQQP